MDLDRHLAACVFDCHSWCLQQVARVRLKLHQSHIENAAQHTWWDVEDHLPNRQHSNVVLTQLGGVVDSAARHGVHVRGGGGDR